MKRYFVIKIWRKKFFSPRFCKSCGKLMPIVSHPAIQYCERCTRHYRLAKQGDNAAKRARRKYNKASYKTAKKRAITNQGYCALCGSTEHLTAHHTCNVETGEWQGQHLTVLCDTCHKIWEQKLSILRRKGI